MGLFVAEDGRYQGWLAALLCCFAAVNEDESPIGNQKTQSQVGIRKEQPKPLTIRPTLNAVWTLNAVKGEQPNIDGTRHVFRVSERAPSIDPLDFGDQALIRTWPTEPEHKRFLSENYGATVFTPHSLRLFDPTEAQKPALIPLRLGPVVLRDLPSPEHDTVSLATSPHSMSTGTPSILPYSPVSDSEYLEPREAPSPETSRRMSMTTISTPPSVTIIYSQPPLSNRSSTGSIPRLSHQTSRSSIKSRSLAERPKPKRKRSFPLVRRDGDERLDQEILELNTIVEERRGENAKDNTSAQHIAAVAPTMLIGARSETLNAIGSALSRPLTAQSSPRRPSSHLQSSPSRPLLQRPASTSSAWSSDRLSGWLSTILPSPSRSHYPSGEPFYKYQTPVQQHQHTCSMTSTSTTTSCTEERDYPSLTEGPSPISKGHSRTLTDESQYTRPSRPGTGGWSAAASRVEKREKRSIIMANAEVGQAF